MQKNKPNLKIKILMILSMIWTLFTLALVAWWMLFTVTQLENLRTGKLLNPSVYLQQERMIKSEGGVLLLLLVLGGIGLVVALWLLQSQHEKVKSFFSIFTHEIKTSLARLILKSDLISEENPESIAFRELKEETVFLQNQLENALWVAQGFGSIFFEKFDWSMVLRDFEWSWPSLKWQFIGEPFDVRLDRRIFQMVMRNLVQNSIYHGQANELIFRAEKREEYWQMWIEDNGKGFQGNFAQLGEKIERVNAKSGTGIGLWVVQQGIKQLQGSIYFYPTKTNGFGVEIKIPTKIEQRSQS